MIWMTDWKAVSETSQIRVEEDIRQYTDERKKESDSQGGTD